MERQFANVLLYLLCFGLIRVAEFQATQICLFENQKIQIVDGTCQNYYLCVDNGGLFPLKLSCIFNTIFDPTSGTCVTGLCRWQSTTLVPPPCYRYGRFPDASDNTCKKYYLCYWNSITQQYTVMQNLQCPNTLLFNPRSEKCVPPERYTCPGFQG